MDYPIAKILASVVVALTLATWMAGWLARSRFPLPAAERRIGCVDGLRGYLALFVMAHHFVIWLQGAKLGGDWSPPTLPLFNQFGAGAVALFFMTTGLVFYPRVLAGFRACDWLAIYISRVFRLLPAIVLSVALVTGVIVLRTGAHFDAGYFKSALTWVSAIGEPPLLGYPDSGRLNAYVLWSLRYEWIYYLTLLPLSAVASDLVRHFRGPSWLVPASLLFLSLATKVLFRLQFAEFVSCFAVGMLCYEFQRLPRLKRLLCTPAAAVAAVVSLVAGSTLFPVPYTFGLPFFGFFFCCVACGNGVFGMLRSSGALVLGECSYSIYLLHGLALDVGFVDLSDYVGRLSVAQLTVAFPLAVAVVTLVSAASFLWIERPSIRLGASLSRLARRRALPALS